MRAMLLVCFALACQPARHPEGWTGGADVVEVGARGGHAALHRIIRYSRVSGTLTVDDSDPFASGQEKRTPRITRKSIRLDARDREAVERILASVLPDSAALDRRCFPGGCRWIELDGDDRLEDNDIAGRALAELSRFFPELRAY
jgi:hypothetical protein